MSYKTRPQEMVEGRPLTEEHAVDSRGLNLAWRGWQEPSTWGTGPCREITNPPEHRHGSGKLSACGPARHLALLRPTPVLFATARYENTLPITVGESSQ